VLLWRACWHIAVVNSAALALIGLLSPDNGAAVAIPHIEGGVIDIDVETGLPTGS
jgi:predicted amidohydrolase YtcJ